METAAFPYGYLYVVSVFYILNACTLFIGEQFGNGGMCRNDDPFARRVLQVS